MIVVDTNVITYLFVPGDRTSAAEAWRRRHAEWAAPLLWRSEFRNVLVTLIRLGRIELPIAQAIQEHAERLLAPLEFAVDSGSVLGWPRARVARPTIASSSRWRSTWMCLSSAPTGS